MAIRGSTVSAAWRGVHCNTQSNESLPPECNHPPHEVNWLMLIGIVLLIVVLAVLCEMAVEKGYITPNQQ